MHMKISWGWKITILYSCFVVGMVGLVVASSHQKFDLVSNDYYKDEIQYQKVIDANKNMTAFSKAILIHANSNDVIIEFPNELKDKAVKGSIEFYSPVNKDWDKSFKLNVVNNTFTVSRQQLRNTNYVIKVNFDVDGKPYYQETSIQLHN